MKERRQAKIGVVLVTFNRLELLKHTLELYTAQEYLPEYIVVVNNHSTDGTEEFLKKWEKEEDGITHIVLHLEKNMGGSGGFYKGLEKAMKLEADWIWIADDDAFPQKNALQILELYIHKCFKKNIAAICSKNLNNGQIELGHRCRIANRMGMKLFEPVAEAEYEKEYFYCDLFSYVGTAIKKEILLKAGLPQKDFFIYGDDFEHAIRVGQYGKILCVPRIVVNHSTNVSTSQEVSWRDYYETRNNIWIYKTYLGTWSYYVRILMRILTACRSLNRVKLEIFLIGIRDAKNDRLGIHEIYKPGWRIDNGKNKEYNM